MPKTTVTSKLSQTTDKKGTTMRGIIFTVLFLAPAAAFAVEAAPEIPAAPEGAPWWVQAIWPVLFATIIPFIIKFLNKKSAEHQALADAHNAEEAGILGNIKNEFLDKRLIPFLYNAGAHIAETKLPAIIVDASDGGGFEWKKHMSDLKGELKDLAIDKFKNEGLDLVEELGDKYLESLIERAIVKAVPFLPEVVRPVVEDKADDVGDFVGNLIVDKGFGYVKDRWLDEWLEKKEKPEPAADPQ